MLKNIKIDALKPGMYVQSIAQQRGDMKIKNQGKVLSPAMIKALKRQGIIALTIDTSKTLIPEQAPSSEQALPLSDDQAKETVSFDLEVRRAKVLHDKGKGLQKRLLNSVVKGLPVNISIPKEFSELLLGSIDRNPNALMCLTKIREKDSYLLEHSLNVAILLANFAKNIGLSEQEIRELTLTGFLHDIGKIKIPDEILHKPGRLSEQEMNIMRDHVYHGVRVLEQMGIPASIVRTMAEHHERLDGYGYPDGARGEEISQFGRMIGIVDSYDAITADRCYKPGKPSQQALKILLQDSPHKYDLDLVQRFIRCVGIYPVGSLVKLNNEQIGMVIKQHQDKPLQPVVKIFYSIRGTHYMAPKDVDLSNSQYNIQQAVMAGSFGLDFNRFFSEKIAT